MIQIDRYSYSFFLILTILCTHDPYANKQISVTFVLSLLWHGRNIILDPFVETFLVQAVFPK